MLKMDGYEASRQIRTWERIWLRETAKRLPPVAIIDFSASVPRRGGGTVPTGGHRGLCQQILPLVSSADCHPAVGGLADSTRPGGSGG